MAMELIETIELTASTQQVNFTSIPQDGIDLLLVVSARSDRTFNHDAVRVELNNTGGSYRKLTGDGSSVSSPSGASLTNFFIPGSPLTANTFGNAHIYISNYTSASTKSVSVDSVSENNATLADQGIEAGLSTTTSAVTAIKVPALNNFVSGSTFSLFKIS